MSDWEDDDWNAPGDPQPSEALGDWDDEDEDEGGGAATVEEEAAAKKPSVPMRPKKALAKALKQREEEERAKEAAAVRAREQELEVMSAVERKLKLQEMEEEADMENTKDLFSGGNFKAGKSASPPSNQVTIDTFEPTTDADFEKLAAMLGQRLCPFNNNPRRTGRYVQFLKHVFRSLTADLNADDTNDLSTFLGVVSNEKREEQKRSRGIKKKGNKKAVVKVDRADDMRSDRYDDFADDFM